MVIRNAAMLAVAGALCIGPLAVRAQEDPPSPPPDPDAAASAAADEADPFEDDGPATASISDDESKDVGTVKGEKSCYASCGDYCGPLQRRLAGIASMGLDVRGWVSQGLTYNDERPPNNENFPVTFNDRANEYQMNQAYLIMEDPVAQCGCSWDFGGRVDLLYGTDYFFTTAAGLEMNTGGSQRWNGEGARGAGPGAAALYGLAMPQAYAEIYAPFAGGVNLKLGHFYSPMGYEEVMAPENFFYSHSYALQYGEPRTFNGAVAEYQWNNNLSLMLGGTAGWNSYDTTRDQWGVLGGVEWSSTDGCTSLACTLHIGEDVQPGLNMPAFAAASTPDTVSLYSLVLTRHITDRLQYVFQHDFGSEENGSIGPQGFKTAKWYGVNQYLLYDVSCDWSVGCRFEWFRDQDFSRVIPTRNTTISSGGNYYALTMGGNWRPRQNLLFRPELRYDWSDTEPLIGIAGPFSVFSEDSQLTAAFDVIIEY